MAVIDIQMDERKIHILQAFSMNVIQSSKKNTNVF